MSVVLDTGVFFHPVALRRLAAFPDRVVVPAVVFMERCRQIARDGRDPGELRTVLDRMGFEIEAFGPEEAVRYAVRLHDDRAWKRLARDAMIAGHVRPGDVIWTTNARDFEAVGVPVGHIVRVPEDVAPI